MTAPSLSAIWRIGPNPVLTLAALFAAGIEAYVFNRVPETRILGIFQLLLFTSLLWFWLTIAWVFWALLRAIRSMEKRSLRMVFYGLAGIVVYFTAVTYALSWVIFSQINAFPDAHWFRFMQSGYEVVWQEVKRSSARALTLFYGLSALILVSIPFLFRYSMKWDWPKPNRHHGITAFIAWTLLGATACFSFMAIKNSHGVSTLRQTNLTRYSTTVNPAITMAASLLAPYNYEAIKPDLNTALLEPIQPDSILYAADVRTSEPMSVLYLAVESLRGDLLFKEHQGREIMPNLNALARRSSVFTRAYAQSTHTDYSIPSYLSSQYPLRSQAHYYYERDDSWPKSQIYEHLHHYGYRTAIISSDTTNWGEMRNYLWHPTLDVFFDAENLPTTYTANSPNRGYITDFKDTPRIETKSVPDREMVDFDIAWIKNAIAEDTPWFLYSFFYQPHYPYKIDQNDPHPFQPSTMDFDSTFMWFPPEKMDVMRNAYYNAVYETDAQIGRLVSFLTQEGQMDNTIIVLTGDHGEAFGEHGPVTHAGPLFEEVVRVPLIIYAPGVSPQIMDYPVQQIDAAPTVCALLGIPAHPGFQGVDALSADRPPLEERDIYLHAEPPSSWRGDAIVHGGRWKFWHDRYSDVCYLFDLQNDLGEFSDVKNKFPEISNALQSKLKQWRDDQLSYYTFKRYYEQYYAPDK